MTTSEGRITNLDHLQDTITSIMKAMVAWNVASSHTSATALLVIGIDEMKRLNASEEELKGLVTVLWDMPLLEIKDDGN